MTNKLLRSILIRVGSIVLLSLSVIGYLWISSEYDELTEANRQYTEQYLKEQKQFIKANVLQVKQRLIQKHQLETRKVEQNLKAKVERAHRVAESIYHKYRNQLSDSQIKAKIIESLRYIRWQNGKGYYYIMTTEGLEIMFPPDPSKENQPTKQAFGEKVHAEVDRILQLADTSSQGKVNYIWKDPVSNEQVKKYGYIKVFEPYNWIIGSGEYQVDLDRHRHREMFEDIASLKFGPDQKGYYFINTYDGDLIVTNNSYFPHRPNIKDTKDNNKISVVQENTWLAQRYPAGAFNVYSWTQNDGSVSEKISFVIGLEDWDIFIGAGVNLDSIEQVIEKRKTDLQTRLKERISKGLGIFMLGFLIMILTMYLISLKLKRNFETFRESFAKAATTKQHIDRDSLFFSEFRELAGHANSMIDNLNKQSHELRHQAFHDPLTRLPNRLHGTSHLTEIINHAAIKGDKVALLFIDLDNFKEVNDSLGHSYGDSLLKEVSQRLLTVVGPGDKVARLGGDEFTIITDLISDKSEAEVLANKVLKLFDAPFQLSDMQYFVTVSVGLSVYPDDGANAELLLRNADSAMYHAKDAGKNNYRIYNREMTDRLLDRVVMIEELRKAITHQQFTLYYQPQISIKTGKVIGAEALIRWFHPERGMIPPDQFIAYAEYSGQINVIGEWVIRQACEHIVSWQKLGIDLPAVAVNVSSSQLQDEYLSEKIATILQETGCKSEWLELEITESMIMDDPERAISYLSKLRNLGIKISVDDFGTGYSSLNYLKTLPVDTLKIDRTFVYNLENDKDDQSIIKAILALGHSLNLSVIAEGVENEAQLSYLNKYACDQAQGYHISRPLPESELLVFLKNTPVIEFAEDAYDELIKENTL